MQPMIPTWIFGYPTGKETGSYLAVDLGGTNMRVCEVELEGDGRFAITQSKYKLTDEQKQGEASDLFDFCAECLASFIKDHYEDENGRVVIDKDISLGFTFSYPSLQERIDHAVLLRWTKGWGVKGVEGEDVVAQFRAALDKAHVPVKITACINDTAGTLMASHYVDPRTRIGVIFGTGCNAAYVEKVKNIPKIAHLGLPEDELMCINMEWGAFVRIFLLTVPTLETNAASHFLRFTRTPRRRSICLAQNTTSSSTKTATSRTSRRSRR